LSDHAFETLDLGFPHNPALAPLVLSQVGQLTLQDERFPLFQKKGLTKPLG
jgi:hypothetical protein|tara:strand:- start:159 stop:311 length:153 start_codon:yes stop_codon:yes gene_type:complete